MTVRELRHLLSSFDDDTEVRVASQQQWPFEYSISTVALTDINEMYEIARGDNGWQVECTGENGEVLQDGFDDFGNANIWLQDHITRQHADYEEVVYIAEGTQLGYLPGPARAAVGW